MSSLTQALQEIDHWIENSKSWHANHLRKFRPLPGLEREMIELFSEEFDFKLSQEVYELYQWHNGGMLIGDMANPVSFISLDFVVEYIMKGHYPYRPYMPLFIGDEAYYVIPEAASKEDVSPIFFFDGYMPFNASKPSRGSFCPKFYAPSISNLMQAVAECARKFDGISAEHMAVEASDKDIYLDYTRHSSILSPTYAKYGVVGDASGLWR